MKVLLFFLGCLLSSNIIAARHVVSFNNLFAVTDNSTTTVNIFSLYQSCFFNTSLFSVQRQLITKQRFYAVTALQKAVICNSCALLTQGN